MTHKDNVFDVTSRGLQTRLVKTLEREFLGVLAEDGLETAEAEDKLKLQLIARCARHAKGHYFLDDDVGHLLSNLELMAVAVSSGEQQEDFIRSSAA